MKSVLLSPAAKLAAKAQKDADLKAAATAAANALGSAAPTIGAVDGKNYEAWAMLELGVAFTTRPSPLKVEVCDNAGGLTGALRVADGPRFLSGSTLDPQAPGFLRVCGVPHREIHNSLRHKGRSPSDHELDIAIIQTPAAKRIRAAGGGPMTLKPALGLELKDYAPPATLDKNIARALLGVALDLGGAPRDMAAFWDRPGRFALLTPTGMTAPTQALLRYYDVVPAPETTPQSRTLNLPCGPVDLFEFLSWAVRK
jgi:hypothetical protein